MSGAALDVRPGGTTVVAGHRLDRARVRAVTGDDELVLAAAGTTGEQLLTMLLDRCVDDLTWRPMPEGDATLDDAAPEDVAAGGPAVDASALTVGDRTALTLAIRQVTLGPRIDVVVTCTTCGEPLDVTVPVDAISVPPLPDGECSEVHAVTVDGRSVEFRLPTGADLAALADLPTALAADALYARCLVDPSAEADDARDPVVAAMERLDPQAEIVLDADCAACGAAMDVGFDVGPFVLEEIARHARDRDVAVHLFALHYHWREADTLGLPIGRRRSYLRTLSDHGVEVLT